MGDGRVVLGYSGLHGSEQFRRAWLGSSALDADMQTYQGQDAAAALIVDGALVAAVQEERFSGRKFDGDLPVRSIIWCLEQAGLSAGDVDAIGHSFDYGPVARLLDDTELDRGLFREVYSPALQQQHLGRLIPELALAPPVTPVRHHVAHAMCGVTAAGVEDAAVLVVDGMGEIESISMFRWSAGRLARLRTFGPRSSLGILYSLVTRHLGFLPASDEYQVMGLAPYGDPDRFAAAMTDAITLTPRGVDVPVLDFTDGNHLHTETLAWLERESGFPERVRDAPVLEVHKDFAAALQQRVSRGLQHLVEVLVDLSGCRRVVVVGGVALNCAAIGHIAARNDLELLFVPPAPADDGTAVGAAAALSRPDGPIHWPPLPLLGPAPVWESKPPPATRRLDDESLTRLVADLLVGGATVGWCVGRLEFGPRALGSRSILAVATSTDMRDRVNRIVKERAAFRPLAPVVLAEHADEWFEIPPGANVAHMTTTVTVRSAKRSQIQGVVHVDGTARVQCLRRGEQPLLELVMEEVRRQTGVPMVMNTSLNRRGQPIARTGDDAFGVFATTDLDVLVVDRDVWAKDPSLVEACLSPREVEGG